MKIKSLLLTALLLSGNFLIGQNFNQDHKQTNTSSNEPNGFETTKNRTAEPERPQLKTLSDKKSGDNLIILDSTNYYTYTTIFDSTIYSRTLYSHDGNTTTFIEYELSDDEQSWVPERKVVETTDGNQNLLESITYEWEKDYDHWEELDKLFQEFNASGQLTKKIDFFYDHSWDTSDMQTYEYTQNGKLDEYKWYENNSNNNTLYVNSKEDYSYNSNDSISEIIHYRYNSNSGNLENEKKIAFEYNESNLRSREIESIWFSGAWQWNRKWEHSYNPENEKDTTEILTWDFLLFSWEEDEKVAYEYNEADRMTLKSYAYWVADSNKYIFSDQTEWVYENDNLTWKIIYNKWNNSEGFVPDTAWEYRYNMDLLKADIFYNDYDDGWKGESKTVFAYDNNGNKTVRSSFGSNFNDDTWELYGRKFYYYTDMTSTESPEENSDFVIYPNPAHEKVRLSTNADVKDEKLKFIIYDYRGKQVFSKELPGKENSEITWNCNEYPAGTYIAVLETDGNTTTRKIVVK